VLIIIQHYYTLSSPKSQPARLQAAAKSYLGSPTFHAVGKAVDDLFNDGFENWEEEVQVQKLIDIQKQYHLG